MMYEEYFGLKENPFSIAPDPHYFYISARHREALAHLMYSFHSEGGFVLLTGEVGTGKTTVCRRMLENAPENCDIAFILYPKLDAEELLATVCDEFGIDCPEAKASSRVLVAKIYDYLVRTHEAGRKAILIVEEAQNLTDEVLEQVRLLTNLETNRQKLLQIVMLGQPELRERLSRPELSQLSQRITARYHLAPLSKSDIPDYISHRLSVAGYARGGLFSPSAINELYRLTGGVPRLINVICDRALMGARAEMKDRVDKKTLTTAAREVLGDKGRGSRRRPYAILPFFALFVLFVVLAAVRYDRIALPFFPVSNRGAGAPKTLSAKTAAQPHGLKGTEVVRATAASLDQSGLTAEDKAYQALFEAWQIRYKPGAGAVCTQALEQGLACLEGKESIASLRVLNKPAILRLSGDGGPGQYMALTSLGPTTATVVDGTGSRAIDAKEIDRRWSGESLILWRMPSGYATEVKRGDRGPFVAWIGKQLASAQGRSPAPGRDGVYDNDMANAVQEFQAVVGLTADGKVGPKTLIALTDRPENNQPHLNDSRRRP
jgi:general secretion pathway protein A